MTVAFFELHEIPICTTMENLLTGAQICCQCRKDDEGRAMAVKTVSKPKDVSSKYTPRTGTAGTGACFLLNPQGCMVFTMAAPASSALEAVSSGLLKKGDVLIKVDDEDVQGRHISELASKLLGHPGTTVKLTFRRGLETTVNVPLERRFPYHI
jgi:hypothetical protein